MAESPAQLGYAPPTAWHRRCRTRRIVLVIALLGVALASTKWLSAGWRHARLLYWQRLCLNYTIPSEQNPDRPEPAPIKAWQEFYRLFSPPGRRAAPVIFLHEMRRKDGAPRLVVIELFTVVDKFTGRGPSLDYHVIDPAGAWSHPRLLACDSWTHPLGDVTFQYARPDPNDPAHITITFAIRQKYGDPDQRGIIDAWLQPDDSLMFELRESMTDASR